MKNQFRITVLFSVFILSGCYYDKEEELYGALPCDTSNVTYAASISSIMGTYGCLSCHGNVNPSAGIVLNNYTGVKAAVVNGSLYGSLNHSQGFAPMPQGAGKISNCDLSRIKAWIDSGAPNN